MPVASPGHGNAVHCCVLLQAIWQQNINHSVKTMAAHSFDAVHGFLRFCLSLSQVLNEAMSDKQTRKSRAQALQVLGRLFQDAAMTAISGSPQVCTARVGCMYIHLFA